MHRLSKLEHQRLLFARIGLLWGCNTAVVHHLRIADLLLAFPHSTDTFLLTEISPLLMADLLTTEVASFDLPPVLLTTILSTFLQHLKQLESAAKAV